MGAANKRATSHARGDWSDAERQARCELAACYRLLAHFGMSDLTYTFVTAKISDGTGNLLVNGFGPLFDEVSASTLVKIDVDGNVLDDPTGFGVNPAAFVIHGAIHKARPELGCVLHAHTTSGVAVSAQQHGLLPLSQYAMKFYERVGYHDYEGIAVDTDECERLVQNLGRHRALFLYNHGTVVAGETIAEAFQHQYFLERACRVQVQALAGGSKVKACDPAAAEKTARLFETHPETWRRDWDSLVRMLDRMGVEFRA